MSTPPKPFDEVIGSLALVSKYQRVIHKGNFTSGLGVFKKALIHKVEQNQNHFTSSHFCLV